MDYKELARDAKVMAESFRQDGNVYLPNRLDMHAEAITELASKTEELEKQLAEMKQNCEMYGGEVGITSAFEQVDKLKKQLAEAKLNRPFELSGQGAENFALAIQLSEMQQKLKEVTAERDAAIARAKKAEDQRNNLFVLLDDVCKNVRERHVDDSVCGLCEYDGATIGESGEWTCECPGFERDDCFCMKKSIRKNYGQKGE